MKELNRLEQILNEHLVANKRIHIESQQLVNAIKQQLEQEVDNG